MEEKPKRGRPRKTVDVPTGIEEGADASNDNARNGQVSGVGTEPPANNGGTPESWMEFVDRVKAAQKATNNDLRFVWHPSPDSYLIPTDHATIAVLQGEVRGQTVHGKYIDL